MVLKYRCRLSLAFIILILTLSFLSLVSLSPSARALSLYNSGNPTAEEQLVLEYINRARANPIAEGQRLGIDIHEGLQDDPQNGCYGPQYVGVRPPLAMNPILLGTARAHSQDMYTQNYFSHSDPNGTTAFQRIQDAGYDYVSVGENIGAGTQMTAAALEDLLMTDPGYQCRGHRMNLLDIFPYPPPAYYEMGVGYYQGPSGQAFITQDFGTATNIVPFLTGVVYNDANGNNFYDIGEGIPGVTITPSSGAYYAISSSSGGYAIPIGTSGTITVTASAAGFGPITKTITLTGTNIELDFTPQGSSLLTTTTSQSYTQTTSQSTTQTQTTNQPFVQTTTLTTTTSFQTVSQMSSTSTTPPLLQLVTFESAPSNFEGTTLPGTITACGNTFSSSQSAAACNMSFGATANLPAPSAGWRFDHWSWAGGVACSSDTANPVSCSAYNSGGVLIAVYATLINATTNPASSALITLGPCSSEVAYGGPFYTTTFGATTVSACNIPPGYTFLGWNCTGGLACPTTSNPASVTISGPGSVVLNLQAQTANNTSTSMSTSSVGTSSTSSVTSSTTSVTSMVTTSTSQTSQASTSPPQLTMTPIPGFPWESIIAGLVLGFGVLALVRRREKDRVV